MFYFNVNFFLNRTEKVHIGTEANQDVREGNFEMTRSGANGVDGLTEAGIRNATASSMHFTDVVQGAGRSKDNIFERAVYCFRYDDEDLLREIQGKYIQAKVHRVMNVVSISIFPPFFKPVLLSLSRFLLSKTPKQVFF